MASYFVDINKLTLKFIQTGKRPSIDNISNKVRRLTPPNFKTYCTATVIKILWYWWKNRQKEQQNIIGSPEINPRKYSQLNFDKGAKAKQRGKENLFNKWCWNNWTSTCKK